jgi:hypothetical protein
MGTRLLSASALVAFEDDGFHGTKNLTLEIPNQLLGPGGSIEVRLYPAVLAELHTSHGGTFVMNGLGKLGTLNVTDEFLTLEGGNRFATAYHAVADVIVDNRWGTYFLNEDGVKFTPILSYDYDTGEVVVENAQDAYGALAVSYTTSYHKCSYTPRRTGSALSRVVTYDTLFAFFEGAATTYKTGRGDFDDGRDYEEVIVVSSEMITDAQGTWETPDDLGTSPTVFGGVDMGTGPNKNRARGNRRVHVYVYYDPSTGRLFERRPRVTLEKPFPQSTWPGVPNPTRANQKRYWYKPKYSVTKSIPTDDGDDPVFRTRVVDKINAMYEDLLHEFTGTAGS